MSREDDQVSPALGAARERVYLTGRAYASDVGENLQWACRVYKRAGDEPSCGGLSLPLLLGFMSMAKAYRLLSRTQCWPDCE
jgi:hypothetical protein